MKMNRTVQRTFEILEYISKQPDGVTLSTIAKDLNLPSSSALDIVKTLYSLDCIYYKDEGLKTYVIGSKLYSIGGQYTKNSLLLEMAKPYVTEVASRFNHVVVIAKRIGTNLVYIYKTPNGESIINLPDEGTHEDLHTTGLGKVLLACSRKKDDLLGRIALPSKTAHTITNVQKLDTHLVKVAGQRYAVGDKEFHEHVKDVAVPVFNFENRVVGSIGMFFLAMEEIPTEVITELQKSAIAVSQKLGFKGSAKDYYETVK